MYRVRHWNHDRDRSRDIALRIVEAYRAGVAFAPVRGEVQGVPAAYELPRPKRQNR
jgi:hypothetical protein